MERRHLLLITTLCGLGYMMYSVDRMVMSSSIGLIAKEFGLSKSLMGILLSSFFYGFVALLFVGGILSDKFSGKTVLIWGLSMFSLATGATGLATGFTTMLVYRVITGIGEGLFWPAASLEIACATTNQQRTTVMSIYWAGYPIGGFLGTWLGAIIGPTYGWRPVFYVAFALGLVVAVLYGVLVRNKGNQTVQLSEKVPLREIFAHKSVVGLGIYYLLLMAGWWIVLLWAPTFLMTTKHMSLSIAGTVASLMGLSGALGGVLIGRFSDKGSLARRKQVLVYITILSAILMAVLTVKMPVWILAILVLLLGFFGYPITPVVLAISSQVVPDSVAGSAVGFVMNVGMLAGAVTPALAGFLAGHMRMSSVWILAAILILVSNLALMFIGKLTQRNHLSLHEPPADVNV